MQTGKRAELPFTLKAFALIPADRAELHRRIAERFDRMMKEGFLDEVRALRRRYTLEAGLPSMRSVGYREAWEFLEGDSSEKEMRERAIASTRQLAKRQMTWLRSLRELEPAPGLELALGSLA
jgi:tRNA dimethylallyltransferase